MYRYYVSIEQMDGVTIEEQTEETALRAVLCQLNLTAVSRATVVSDAQSITYSEIFLDEAGLRYTHRKTQKTVEVREMWKMLVKWEVPTSLITDLLTSSDASVYMFLPVPNGVWLYFLEENQAYRTKGLLEFVQALTVSEVLSVWVHLGGGNGGS